jgi:predicted secreted protein
MSWPASIAIWFLFFTLSLFLVLPFGNRTAEEAGTERPAGSAESAPVNPRMWQKLAAALVLATVIFIAYYANYVNGWISINDIPGWENRGPKARPD